MMIKRRQFLILGSMVGLSPYLQAEETTAFKKEFQQVKPTIEAVQRHMFPKESKLPSAMIINATKFLFETLTHKSFDRDIKAFVLEGAKELNIRENGRFVAMTEKEKEIALRAYEETSYGSSWLSRMMTLTMEGMFSDSIYGANVNEAGWKAVNTFGGFPRPKTKYMES